MKALTHLFEECVSKYPDNPLMWEKTTDKFEAATYAQIREKVYQFTAGLMAMGVNKGDRIALLSEGRNDWVISELGILYAGAVNVPLSVKLGDASEIEFRLVHSGARMIIASHQQARKLKVLKHTLSQLEKVIHLDVDKEMGEKDIAFADIMEKGKAFLASNYSQFEERWKSVQPNDYANICYTSGTTADPKGIIVTHRNYTANVEQSLSLMTIPSYYVSLLILPWDHAFAHTCGVYVLMTTGASMASVQTGRTPMDTLKNIPINIKEIKPHFLMSVPALAKNFRKNIESGIRAKGPVVSWLFNTGLKIGYTYNGIGWDKGKGFRFLLKPLVALFDIIIFKKVRGAFGGRLKFFIGGGALLDIELQRFFYAIGIPMFQGYGLSEASPVISSNSERKHKLGSSGYLVTPMDLKICDDKGNELPVGEKGEIVVRGENVMAGYWNNPVATADSLKDGWLHTGDMGSMDKDGFLYVFGRFKSLLISDDGEKYSPEGIEEAFVGQSAIIDQCMLYNNQNPYTIALVYPNKEVIKRWLAKENLAGDTEEGQIAILKLIESELNEYRVGRKHEKMFPQRWLPAAIGILPEGFTEDNHLMNSTLKMVRGKITERYKDLITYLYTPEAKDICNSRNMDVINGMGFDGSN
ncbi:MAG TPA: AMP-binding protein [Bacteroidales bacterium]|nr:AMP-binding protein [Bacteroidales bacterium]